MDKLAGGYRVENTEYSLNELNGKGMGLNSHPLMIIELPDSWVLRVIARSLFLALIIILAVPSIGSVLKTSSNVALYEHDADSSVGYMFKILPILFHDLLEEGLIKKGQKGFILGAREDDFVFLKDAGIDLIAGPDLKQGKFSQHHVFDFVFSLSFSSIRMFDGMLRDGGLAISRLGNDPLTELGLLRNYKIVYLRRFKNTVAVMRKTGASLNGDERSPHHDRFVERKKDALKGLEDAYLEPPRRSSLAKKSSFTSRKIKFLPDLLKDSLDQYPRRVFISDQSSALDWFYKNYPTRNQEFEVYNMDTVGNNHVFPQETSVSSWLRKNLKRNDYVVMKVEAQVVEELLKDSTIHLVDELFLECRNQWQGGENSGSKRAYWQCLALYGKLKDEGIAVHQWWN